MTAGWRLSAKWHWCLTALLLFRNVIRIQLAISYCKKMLCRQVALTAQVDSNWSQCLGSRSAFIKETANFCHNLSWTEVVWGPVASYQATCEITLQSKVMAQRLSTQRKERKKLNATTDFSFLQRSCRSIFTLVSLRHELFDMYAINNTALKWTADLARFHSVEYKICPCENYFLTPWSFAQKEN